MKKLVIFILLAFLLTFGATPAYAVPALPHAFYGSVTINGSLALDGTQISATVDSGEIVATQNPVTTVGGTYGIDSPLLLVQGDIPPGGATITFHVTNENGTDVGGTYDFETGGGPTKVDLLATIAEPTPPPPVPPAAEFSASPTTGTAPLTVSFTDESTGAINTWSWSFGDGGTSTEQSPSYTYSDAGIYDVSLEVTGPGGSDTETKFDYITVSAAPVEYELSISSTAGGLVHAVKFTGTSAT